MIKRQISFLFEDPGFCIDVFCTIAEPVRYYTGIPKAAHGTALHRIGMKMAVSSGKTLSLK